jgi:excisionase family DNA binding protein
MHKDKLDLPISEKLIWSVSEASKVTGLGEAKIRELTKQENCPFVLRVGRLIKIKRKEFEEYISNTRGI